MRAAHPLALALLALAACTVDVPHFENNDLDRDAFVDSSTEIDAADIDAPTDAAMIDAPMLDAIGDGPSIDAADGLGELIGRDWTVPAGGEALKCVRVMVPEATASV